MRRALSALAVVAVLLLARPVAACLWDYDTLAAEARGRMADVVHIIAGRFERNPPLYYELRLKRSAERIAADPDDLDAYDDAGVACDRLGRSDEAIAWMEEKAMRLTLAEANAAETRDIAAHRYRYLANIGTFWVHRWARNGADRSKIDEVKTARDFIAKAIALNPDAHFGRETYQLKALDWIINPVHHGSEYALSGFLDPADPANSTDATIRGLSGLIALGNAWESVDVFNTLAQALVRDGGRSSVALLAVLRAEELVDAGRRSLDPAAPTDPEALKYQIQAGFAAAGTMGPRDKDEVKAAFRALRAEADAWHAARLTFMLPRLEAGRHPDTDPTFWQGYAEKAPPTIPAVLASVRTARSGPSPRAAIRWGLAAALGLATLAALALPVAVRRLSRGDRRKPVASSEF